MNLTFTDYEDAALRLLAPLKAPAGPLAVLKGFAGEIVLTEVGILLVLLNQFPAVLLEVGDADYTPGPNPFDTEEPTLVVHVCARSLRSQEEAVKGVTVGAYALVDQVRSRLNRKQLGQNLSPLKIKRITRLAAGKADDNAWVAVYRMEFKFVNPRIEEG